MSSARSDTVEQFHHLAIVMLRKLRNVDEANGFSGPRASALSVLVFRGPQSLGDLAAAEGVKPPTMSRLVKAMQAEGLVESQVAEHDQRAVRIAPSAKGRRLMLRAREKRLAAIRELLRDASAEEKKALETVVGLLGRALRKR
ncbi:MAG TPA: MarR family transcriptional regulator [Usitatibacter sp.]|nr:MarR family transcriptional regulator [Usitatibacter sp.]